MTSRRAAAIGGAVTFVAAGIAGAAGGQLAESALWGWTTLIAALLLGASATWWTTLRTTPDMPPGPDSPPMGGPNPAGEPSTAVRIGEVSASGGQAAGVIDGSMVQNTAGSSVRDSPHPDVVPRAVHPPTPGGVQIGTVSAPTGQAAGVVHGNMIQNRGASGT